MSITPPPLNIYCYPQCPVTPSWYTATQNLGVLNQILKQTRPLVKIMHLETLWRMGNKNNHFVEQEETLAELMELASNLPWANALEVWRLNNSLKKRRGRRRGPHVAKGTAKGAAPDAAEAEVKEPQPPETQPANEDRPLDKAGAESESSSPGPEDAASEPKVLKFRVTCNRSGDKHSFSSNEAARDFGGAIQDFFQWKADMTKFDIEVCREACVRATPGKSASSECHSDGRLTNSLLLSNSPICLVLN